MKAIFPKIVGNGFKVPVYGGAQLPYINLDNAATTAPFELVLDKVNEVLPFYGSVHRGSGYKSILSTSLVEEARKSILEFADGHSENDVIIFGVNATDCINRLARRINFQGSEVVIVSEAEHSSNLLPWIKNCRIIQCKPSKNVGEVFDLNHLEELLTANRVRLVSVTGASNITGKITDLDPIATLAHKYDTEIFVDASQLAGHRKIKRGIYNSLNYIDYLVFSGHKMYAPFGVGVLIARKEIFEHGWPDMVGGGSVKWLDNDDIIWADLPEREIGGTPNFIGIVALGEACRIINRIGYQNIQLHEQTLVEKAFSLFNEIKSLTLVDDTFDKNQIPIFSFILSDFPHGLVGTYLANEHAIGVRTGTICQYQYLKKFFNWTEGAYLNLKLSLKTLNSVNNHFGIIRASCGLGNSINDLTKLATAIKALQKNGSNAVYYQDNFGKFHAENFNYHNP